jgi:phosphonate transport system permease protein
MSANVVKSPAVEETLMLEPSHLLIKLLSFGAILAVSIWSFTSLDFQSINQLGLQIVKNLSRFLVNPNYAFDDTGVDYIQKYLFTLEDYGVPYLMYETIMIAFMGTLFGAIISVPFAFFSSKNISGKTGSWVGSLIVTSIRTVPIFIWGLLFIRVKGGPMAGVLAVSISSIGMISKLYIEIIEDIDKGILEALDSTGATTLQKIRFGIIPQLTASFLSIAIYRFEINVKNAAILGMVGAGGIGFTLIDALANFNFGVVAVCLWGLIPVVLAIEYISTAIRSKLV